MAKNLFTPKEEKSLRARSKNLCDLVISEEFTVEEVISYSHSTLIISEPSAFEVKYDGSPIELETYRTGFTSETCLRVKPKNNKVGIEYLIFIGSSIVKKGDYISAKIPKYEEKKLLHEASPNGLRYETFVKEVFYLERKKFNQKEKAIELSILSEKGDILRIDKAVDYNIFNKDKKADS